MPRIAGLFLIVLTTASTPAGGAEASDPTLLLDNNATLDAYGPDLHGDATGRPYRYETREDEPVTGPVQKDAYGPGVHMDQYGRPVYATPAFGQ